MFKRPYILVSNEISWPPALLGVLGVTLLLLAALLLGGRGAGLLVPRAALLTVHGAAHPLRHHLALLPRPRHALLRTLGLRHAARGYLTQGFLEFAAAVCGEGNMDR